MLRLSVVSHGRSPSPRATLLRSGTARRVDEADGAIFDFRFEPTAPRSSGIATIAVGGSPQAVTIADGRAWVTVDQRTISPTQRAAGGGPCDWTPLPMSPPWTRRWQTTASPSSFCMRLAQSCSTTPTRRVSRDRSSCPRSPNRCLRARPTDGAGGSSSALPR